MFYTFFRLLPFFPLFRLLTLFPLFRLLLIFPLFRLLPFFRFSAFYPFFPQFHFRFSVYAIPLPRFTLTRFCRCNFPSTSSGTDDKVCINKTPAQAFTPPADEKKYVLRRLRLKQGQVQELRAVERGGVPGVTTPGPGPKRGPDTNCYKFTSTARYEVKLIAG